MMTVGGRHDDTCPVAGGVGDGYDDDSDEHRSYAAAAGDDTGGHGH